MDNTIRLTEKQMQVLMSALYFTGAESDEAADLHDILVEAGFSRFDSNDKMADLLVLDASE